MIPKTRQQALVASAQFYNTGRPCRKGHLGNRYASSGTCVECQIKASTDFQQRYNQNKRLINSRNFNDTNSFVGTVPPDWMTTFQYLQDIAINASEETQRTIKLAIQLERSRIPANLPQEARIKIHPVLALARAEILAYLNYDEERDIVTNFEAFPISTGDLVLIELGGHWYEGNDIMAVIRGQLDYAERRPAQLSLA